MTTTMAHVDPEEMMAWLDRELPADEAVAVAAHVEECAACAAVATQFRRTSEELASWSVPDAPASVERVVMRAVRTGVRRPSRASWHWGRWATGMGAAVALLFVVVSTTPHAHMMTFAPPRTVMQEQLTSEPSPTAPPLYDRMEANGNVAPMLNKHQLDNRVINGPEFEPQRAQADKIAGGGGGAPAAAVLGSLAPPAPGPMIARTVSLTMRVKDAAEARSALEAILARHHGYMAQLNASGAEGSPRALQASLRIPAGELGAALKEMRSLGQMESETQSGEEVTAQHEDLEARLKNARETEARMQAILQQRTGRISDVLEVEQEIAQVRGEIEGMEAEQAGLEHRVVFASVEVSLTEEYKAEFRAPDSVGTRMRNALVAGYGNARDSVLGLVIFVEEYGPAIAVWLIVLGAPAIWGWRRYRRVRRAG